MFLKKIPDFSMKFSKFFNEIYKFFNEMSKFFNGISNLIIEILIAYQYNVLPLLVVNLCFCLNLIHSSPFPYYTVSGPSGSYNLI